VKRVAVLGGGPAGAFAAERLVRGGLDTVLIDEKLAWEKPCGGGLTYKAYQQYPFLINNDVPKRLVRQTCMSASNSGGVMMELSRPLVIYSRLDLNRMLLERAEQAGVQLEKTRVLEVTRGTSRWRIKTRDGSLDADFCIAATGARNPLRNVGTEWRARDTMYALGYYVPSDQEHIDIRFLEHLEGYIWVFPRCGHLSVGICGKGEPAQSLRARAWSATCRRTESARRTPLSMGTCCRRWKGRRGAGIECREKDGWRWGTRRDWWIRSRAKVCITRCDRAI